VGAVRRIERDHGDNRAVEGEGGWQLQKDTKLKIQMCVIHQKNSRSLSKTGATRVQVYKPPMTHWETIFTQ